MDDNARLLLPFSAMEAGPHPPKKTLDSDQSAKSLLAAEGSPPSPRKAAAAWRPVPSRGRAPPPPLLAAEQDGGGLTPSFIPTKGGAFDGARLDLSWASPSRCRPERPSDAAREFVRASAHASASAGRSGRRLGLCQRTARCLLWPSRSQQANAAAASPSTTPLGRLCGPATGTVTCSAVAASSSPSRPLARLRDELR